VSGLVHILNVTRSADWEVEERKKKKNWFLTKVQDIVLQRVKRIAHHPTIFGFSNFYALLLFFFLSFMFRKGKKLHL
jgi:hypothetical protein